MIDCRLLGSLRNLSAESGFTGVEIVAVILGVFKEGYGRVAVSRKTGIGERRIRNVYEYLNTLKTIKPGVYEAVVGGLVNSLVETDTAGEYHATVVSPVDPGLLRAVESRVVELRDWIIVETRSRDCIEVIGVVDKGVSFPRLPPDLVVKYAGILPGHARVNYSIVILWRKYIPLLYESAVLSALANMCVSEEPAL